MAAYDEFPSGSGGVVEVETPKVKKPTKLERYNAWKEANKEAYRKALNAHTCCTPSRADMLLVQQYECGVSDWQG